MAWTYSNWPSAGSSSAQLTSLRLHIQEVSDSVGKEVSADGKAVSSDATQKYLDTLLGRLDKLEARAGRGIGGGVSVAGFGSTST